jgi:hypothetical protein
LFWLCVQYGLRTAKLKNQKEYSSRKYERTALFGLGIFCNGDVSEFWWS